jgi:hypothetical protein
VVPVHKLEVFHAQLGHAALEVQVVHCTAAAGGMQGNFSSKLWKAAGC